MRGERAVEAEPMADGGFGYRRQRKDDPVAGVEQGVGGEFAVGIGRRPAGVGLEQVGGGNPMGAGEFGDADALAQRDLGALRHPGIAVEQERVGVALEQQFRAALGILGQDEAFGDGDLAEPPAGQDDDVGAAGERLVGAEIGVVFEQPIEGDVLLGGDGAQRGVQRHADCRSAGGD